jgi:ATP-binding cassette subfamily B protein
MTSSAESRATIEPLPPALSSIWRLCVLGYRHEPRLILAAFSLSLVAAVPDALLAYWFKLLGDGALRGDWALVRVAVLALGLSATATWFLVTVSTRVQRRFRDKVTIALESHVATLLASISTIAHHERPEYLDRLSVLRNQVFMLDHMYMSLFSTCGWILRLAVTVGLLMSIHPALALLVLCALPPVWTSSWRPDVERRAQERGAAANRLSRHLFDVATTASPGKDVRLTGIAELLIGRRRQTWEAGQAPIAAARWTSAAWHAAAWAVFGAGYVGAIVFVTRVGATAGDVLLALAAGSRLSFYVGAAVGEIGFLRGVWMDSARRLAWLEDYAAAVLAPADQPAPTRLSRGVRF